MSGGGSAGEKKWNQRIWLSAKGENAEGQHKAAQKLERRLENGREIHRRTALGL